VGAEEFLMAANRASEMGDLQGAHLRNSAPLFLMEEGCASGCRGIFEQDFLGLQFLFFNAGVGRKA
jgi:hypothetical protein